MLVLKYVLFWGFSIFIGAQFLQFSISIGLPAFCYNSNLTDTTTKISGIVVGIVALTLVVKLKAGFILGTLLKFLGRAKYHNFLYNFR